MKDDDNPQFIYSLTNTKLLMQIANGELDSVQLAKETLANRGIGRNGLWSGLSEAAKQWSVQVKPPIKFVSQNVLDAWSEVINHNNHERKIDYIKLHNGIMITITQNRIRIFDADDVAVKGSEINFRNITTRKPDGKE